MNDNELNSQVTSMVTSQVTSMVNSSSTSQASSATSSASQASNPGTSYDDSPDYQKLMHQIQDMINQLNGDTHHHHHHEDDLKQFHKSQFYKDWWHRFHRLGERGAIAIPNTTFEEWLVWFWAWAQAFQDDYNKFKDLVLNAIETIEKHLEIIDGEIDDINKHLQKIDEEIDQINAQLKVINQQIQEIINSIKELGGKVDKITNDVNNIKNDVNNANNNADNANKNAQDAIDQLKKVAVATFWQTSVTNVNTEWLQYGATNSGDNKKFWIQPRTLKFVNGTEVAGFDIHNYLKKTKAINESAPVVLFTVNDPTGEFSNACTRTPRFLGPHLVWYGSHDNPNDHNFYYGGTVNATDDSSTNPTAVFADNSLWF